MEKVPELVIKKVNDKGATVHLLNTRLTFLYLDAPSKPAIPNAKPKYSATALIPKSVFNGGLKDEFFDLFKDILSRSAKISASAVMEKDKDKNGKPMLRRVKAWNTATNTGNDGSFFKIGNDAIDKNGKIRNGMKDTFYFAATVDAQETAEGYAPRFPIALVDRKGQTIAEHEIKREFYNGIFGHLVLNLQPYDYLGKLGIKAYLNGVVKVADGEPLSSANPFEGIAFEDGEESEGETNVSFDDEPKGKKRRK